MKTTPIIQYIFFGIVLLLLSACDKDPSKPGYQSKPPKPEYYRIKMSEDLKSYLWSNIGSYWIYKCDLTGELDSQYCVSSDAIVRKAIGVKRVYDFENIYSNNRSLKYKTNILMQGQTSDPDIINFDFGIVWQRNINGRVASILNTWQYKDRGYGNGLNITYFREKFPSFLVEGREYHDVLVYEVIGDPTFPKPSIPIWSSGDSKYYWAKGVGLIKIEHKNQDKSQLPNKDITLSWNLIDYKTNY
jgi:hypothetical protein